MQHSFDISIAEKYGVNVAIFLNHIAFWIKKNEANEKHFYDGRYWTYNSSKAFSKLFPYWSDDTLDRLIKKCISLKLLTVNNFNETTYNRTRWYGLTDIGLSLFNMPIPRNRGMDSAESPLPFREIAESIIEADIKTDVKPEERQNRAPRSSLSDDFLPDDKNQELLKSTAARVGLSVNELLSKFRAVVKEKGKRSKDWQASLEKFLLSEKRFDNTNPQRRPQLKEFERPNQQSCAPVKEWGPGHSGWESINKFKSKNKSAQVVN